MIDLGSVIADKYWVERVLGRGGMGVVVAATHLQLGQRVALKFLKPEAARDSELVERFLREARASCRLRGEHVGKVLDVGTSASGPYIVMEYLEGHDLASELARGGPLPIATAVDYVLQACLGLVEAHAAGVVHRDLKPANLFLTRRPDGTALVKVMDFGIAKAAGAMDAGITESMTVMGSPGYMSPEQLRSARDVDGRADLWSLGVVLYELITGRRPYEATTITELAMLVATEPVPPLPSTVPRGLASTILRALEKDPARRWRDVGALAHALGPFGSAGGVAMAAAVGRVQLGAAPIPRDDGAVALMNATTLSRATSVRVPAVAKPGPWTVRRRRSIVALSMGIGAVAIAILIVGFGRGGSRPTAPPIAPAPIAPAVTSIPVDAGVDGGASLDATAEVVVAPASGSAQPANPGGSATRPGRGTGHGGGRGSTTVGTAPTAGTATPPPSGGSATAGSGQSGATTGSGSAKPGIPGDTDGDGIPDVR